VSRIDAATNALVASIPVGQPQPEPSHPIMVAAHGDDVWVLHPGDHTVLRIDTATNTVSLTIPIGAGANAVTDPQRLAVGPDAVWVTDTHNNQVARVDPETQTVVALIGDIGLAHSIGVTDAAVWVAGVAQREIVRIDPATNQVVARIAPKGRQFDGVYVIGDEIWASDTHAVVRIDPATNQLATTIALPRTMYDLGFGSIAVGAGSVWVVDNNAATLYRIDAATQAVVSSLELPTGAAIAFADGALWSLSAEGLQRVNPAP
jgi:DNA-binding beta-propeller fold protein YncE